MEIPEKLTQEPPCFAITIGVRLRSRTHESKYEHFYKENALENVVCKMAAISFQMHQGSPYPICAINPSPPVPHICVSEMCQYWLR